jgi:hypothetical protein
LTALAVLACAGQAQDQKPKKITLTFTNTLKEAIDVYRAAGDAGELEDTIAAGQRKDFSSNPGRVWRFKRSGDTVKLDEYTATADDVQEYKVHPANLVIANFKKAAADRRNPLRVIFRGRTNGLVQGGDRQVLFVNSEQTFTMLSDIAWSPSAPGFVCRIEASNKPEGFRIVTDYVRQYPMTLSVDADGFVGQGDARGDSSVFTLIPAPGGEGMALTLASKAKSHVLALYKPQIDPDKKLPVGWQLRLQPITAGSSPPGGGGHTYDYASSPDVTAGMPKFPVLEVEALSLAADAPARSPKAPRSEEFKAWVVKEIGGPTDGFTKPAAADLQEAGEVNDRTLGLLKCSRYARRGYNVIYLNPRRLKLYLPRLSG